MSYYTHRALERFPKWVGVLFRIVDVQQRLVFREFRRRGTARWRRVQRDRLAAATACSVVLRITAAHCLDTYTHSELKPSNLGHGMKAYYYEYTFVPLFCNNTVILWNSTSRHYVNRCHTIFVCTPAAFRPQRRNGQNWSLFTDAVVRLDFHERYAKFSRSRISFLFSCSVRRISTRFFVVEFSYVVWRAHIALIKFQMLKSHTHKLSR